MSLTTQEKIDLLNEHSYEVVESDYYEFPEEFRSLVEVVYERRVLEDTDGDYSMEIVVNFDGEEFLKVYKYSSWVGEYGDSEGFLSAEKYTYTEERYRHV